MKPYSYHMNPKFLSSKDDLAHQTLPENIAIYQMILNTLKEKSSEIFFRALLVSSLPDCLQLLTVSQITIEYCHHLSDLSLLSKCRHLNSLNIDSCDQLTTLSGLAEPCSFSSFQLEDYKHLIDLPGDKGYPNLAGRSFSYHEGQVAIDAFKKHSNLNRISISHCKNLIDISSLAACTYLKNCYISDCKKINNISFLNECTMLPNVYITHCNNINESQLEPLKVRCQQATSGIDYYHNCTEKEKEEINKIANKIHDAIIYQEFTLPRLEKKQAIGFSETCPDGATELYISCNDNLRNLEGLQENHNIRTLILESLNHLENLQGLHKLPNLKELSIHQLPNLTSLVGLENSNQLHQLTLSEVSRLTDIKALSHLESLQQLFIPDVESSIGTLEGIEKASSIEILGLGDLSATTHLQSLEQLPNLKRVVLFPDRTAPNDCSINNTVLNNLKYLALPAGVKLLQHCHDDTIDGSEEPYLLDLGSFHHRNTLVSHMASMVEPERDGLSATTLFVANQEPLPIILLESWEAQFGAA